MRDHRDLIVSLARENGWKRGIELGLGSGLLFGRLLAEGLDMIGVDMGRRPERRARVQRLGGCVFWMTTAQAADHVPDGWADFVFIDAGHSCEAVKADIANWQSKVREGGWFGGHDYHANHPGVMEAVQDTFPRFKILPFGVWVRA